MKKTDKPIVIEQLFSASPEILWKAITELDQMKLWFFENIESFNAVKGFKTTFLVSNENLTFTHLWKITEVISEKKIVYNWKYREYKGDSSVIFELFKEEKNTRLRLSTQVHEDFPDNIPEFKIESCTNGWKYFINQRLKEYITSIS